MYAHLKISYDDYVVLDRRNVFSFISVALVPGAYAVFLYLFAEKYGEFYYTGDAPMPTATDFFLKQWLWWVGTFVLANLAGNTLGLYFKRTTDKQQQQRQRQQQRRGGAFYLQGVLDSLRTTFVQSDLDSSVLSFFDTSKKQTSAFASFVRGLRSERLPRRERDEPLRHEFAVDAKGAATTAAAPAASVKASAATWTWSKGFNLSYLEAKYQEEKFLLTDAMLPLLRAITAVSIIVFHVKVTRASSLPESVVRKLSHSLFLILALLCATAGLQRTFGKRLVCVYPFDGLFWGAVLHAISLHDTLVFFTNAKLFYLAFSFHFFVALVYRLSPLMCVIQGAGAVAIAAVKVLAAGFSTHSFRLFARLTGFTRGIHVLYTRCIRSDKNGGERL